MLRLLVLLLIAANAGYFAWTQGHFAFAGWQPARTTEPERLQQQVRPEVVTVLKQEDIKRLQAQAVRRASPECWQSDVLTDAQARDAKTRLEKPDSGWLPTSWALEKGSQAPLWMVYIGPLSTPDTLEKKKSELRKINVGNDTVHPKALGQGLSLGSSHEKAAMDAKLAVLSKQGVRTARVVQTRPALQGQILRFAAVSEEQSAALDAVRRWLPASDDKPLKKCSPSNP